MWLGNNDKLDFTKVLIIEPHTSARFQGLPQWHHATKNLNCSVIVTHIHVSSPLFWSLEHDTRSVSCLFVIFCNVSTHQKSFFKIHGHITNLLDVILKISHVDQQTGSGTVGGGLFLFRPRGILQDWTRKKLKCNIFRKTPTFHSDTSWDISHLFENGRSSCLVLHQLDEQGRRCRLIR